MDLREQAAVNVREILGQIHRQKAADVERLFRTYPLGHPRLQYRLAEIDRAYALAEEPFIRELVKIYNLTASPPVLIANDAAQD